MYPRGHRTNLPPLLRVLPGYMVTTTLWGEKKELEKADRNSVAPKCSPLEENVESHSSGWEHYP